MKQDANSNLGAKSISAERPPVPPAADSGVSKDDNIFIALYEYQARSKDDLTFVKGDKFRVTNQSDGDWWEAVHLTTQVSGFIPSNFVAPFLSIAAEE